MDCLFCKIIAGDIPSSKVYEDENIYAFNDIAPEAPVHVLIVPKTHICCANAITAENSKCVAQIFEKIPEIAKLCAGKPILTLLNKSSLADPAATAEWRPWSPAR